MLHLHDTDDFCDFIVTRLSLSHWLIRSWLIDWLIDCDMGVDTGTAAEFHRILRVFMLATEAVCAFDVVHRDAGAGAGLIEWLTVDTAQWRSALTVLWLI